MHFKTNGTCGEGQALTTVEACKVAAPLLDVSTAVVNSLLTSIPCSVECGERPAGCFLKTQQVLATGTVTDLLYFYNDDFKGQCTEEYKCICLYN